jgi:prevent-host-death family protein
MRDVAASKAQARLSRLLDDVEQGGTIAITRYGRPVARLVPDIALRRADAAAAVAAIKALRKGSGGITAEERLSARDEGRK